MASSVPRSDVFLTTKTFNYSKGDTVESLLPGLIESVKKMHPAKEGEQPYVDLFLIHAPSSGPEGRQTLWNAFQEVSREVSCLLCGLAQLVLDLVEEARLRKGYRCQQLVCSDRYPQDDDI